MEKLFLLSPQSQMDASQQGVSLTVNINSYGDANRTDDNEVEIIRNNSVIDMKCVNNWDNVGYNDIQIVIK